MIEINNITKYFRVGFFGIKKNAVDNLSLSINKGEVTGFFGPNGAGKSTTIKMIVGLIKPSSGNIKINGYNALDYKSRNRLGFLPENPAFSRGLRGIDIIKYYSKILNIKNINNDMESVLNLTGIYYARNTQIHKYSKGMTQRLALAVALLGDPEILIFDEPLSGLDPIGRKEFKDIILHLKEKKKTIFFSSHILADSKELCDRIAVLVNGKLLKNDSMPSLEKEANNFYEKIDDSANLEYKNPLENYLYSLMINNNNNK